MQVGIGVSVGSEVVCSAMVVAHDDGTHTSEYRMISADDQANRDIGELVGSSIDLIASLSPSDTRAAARPTARKKHSDSHAVAVVHRAETDAVRIRSAVGSTPRHVRMIPEADAALAFLHDAGLVASYAIIALVDMGASGTTVTVLEPASGTVLAVERTACVDDTNLDTLIVRVAGAAAQAGRVPAAIVLLGGGARTPAFATILRSGFDMPIIELDEPDAVLAIGGALLAMSSDRAQFPVLTIEPVSKVDSAGRLASILIGAVVVGGLVFAYGLQALIPGDSSGVSPAGTVTNSYPSVDVTPPSGSAESGAGDATSRSSDGRYLEPGAFGVPTIAASTPSLRPAPNLPVLEFPVGGVVIPNQSAGGQPAAPLSIASGAAPVIPAPPITAAPTTDPSTTPEPTTPEPTTPEPTTAPPTTTNPPSTEPADPSATTDPHITSDPATTTALVRPNTVTSSIVTPGTATPDNMATRTPEPATGTPDAATIDPEPAPTVATP